MLDNGYRYILMSAKALTEYRLCTRFLNNLFIPKKLPELLPV
jgi:hypothetical protein